MPYCAPNKAGDAITFKFRDARGREHGFNVHPAAIQEITMKWAAAVEEAARNRGELTTPDGRQILRALYPKTFAVRSLEGDTLALSLFPPDFPPLDFAFSLARAHEIGSALSGSALKMGWKPPVAH